MKVYYSRFYDEDDSGSIELEEMSKVLSNIYQSEGLTQVLVLSPPYPDNLNFHHRKAIFDLFT